MRGKSTWVGLFFIGSAVVVGVVLNAAFGDLFALVGVLDRPILGDRFTLSTLAGFLIASLGAAYYGIVHKRSRKFVEESVEELNKTSWPDMPETRSSTVVVLVFTFISAGILGLFDAVFSWITNNNLFLY
jgi:preprotein translocase subunit SecE